MKGLLLVVLFFQGLVGSQAPGGTIAGRLVSREGQPASGVRVTAMAVPDSGVPASSVSTLVSFVLTDAAGRYRLENVPAGRYYVTAGLVDLPTYYPGVSSPDAATAVNVSSAATVNLPDFIMVVPVGVTVSGRVIRPPGQNLPGIQRAALMGGTPPLSQQQTQLKPDGSFEFLKVRPGTYNLLLSAGPAPQPISITVADKDITGLEVVIPLTIDVTGSVVVEDGGLRPRVQLSFMSYKGGVTLPGVSSVTSTFRVGLPEGEYRLGWSSLPAGYVVKSITAGSLDLLSNSLKIVPGSAPSPIVVTLGIASPPPWVKLSGSVKGIANIPSGAAATLNLSGSAMEPLNVPIKPDGSFEIPRILPGNYSARLNPPIPAPPSTIVVGNKDMSNVEIVVPLMKSVKGQVAIEGLAQLAARLAFNVVTATGNTSTTAVAQADGSFLVTLPEGSHRLSLTVPGYAVKSLNYGSIDGLRDAISISSAESTEFRVTLVPTTAVVPAPFVGGFVVGGGVIGGVIGPQQVSAIVAPPPVRVVPELAQANVISSVQAVYPELARAARVTGTVTLSVEITREGAVNSVAIVSGHPLLNQAAIDAVRQWKFRPQMSNGQPVAAFTTVSVNFQLQ